METKFVLLNITIFLSFFFTLPCEAKDDNCVYSIYVKTGSIIKAGTDSNITLELYSKEGNGVRITEIEKWGGLMGEKHDYFERGNLDIFSGLGPGLNGPVCAIKLISDGSGPHHGWYCDYVDVTTTGPHLGCVKLKFDVGQWLATDVSPYELSALRNYCSSYDIHSKSKSGDISDTRVVPSLKVVTSA